MARTPYVKEQSANTGRTPYLGGSQAKKKEHRGVLGDVAHVAGNFGRDVGATAVGIVPGAVALGKAVEKDASTTIHHPLRPQGLLTGRQNSHLYTDIAKPIGEQYKDYYGHDVLHHMGEHPLQPFLDALTVATVGAGGAAKVGLLSKERAILETRSPRAIGTGKGPKHQEVSSTKPLVRGREVAMNKRRRVKPGKAGGGELKQYGKQIQSRATQRAQGRMLDLDLYHKATKRLSEPEWTALHIRALDIHPDDLAELWHGSDAGKALADPKVRQLVLTPTKKLAAAETAARGVSKSGAALYQRAGLVSDEALAARPGLTRQQAAEMLGSRDTPGTRYYDRERDYEQSRTVLRGEQKKLATLEARLARPTSSGGPKRPRPQLQARIDRQRKVISEWTATVAADEKRFNAESSQPRNLRRLHGKPYYFPHTLEPQRAVNPLAASGGGKGIGRRLGSEKHNTGALALSGKLHLRGDILGPEFLRRVKRVKYDEIHNALIRGSIRVSRDDLEHLHGGKLPSGYEFIREKRTIPHDLRREGTDRVPLDQLIPNPDDLHNSVLAKEGFSTIDPERAHVSNEHYYIAPKTTVKAATGEFTKSSDFVRHFVQQPLSVWRAAVLGLRVGFFTNNLVGNSLMYAVRTGGQGAIRDLFGAIRETHGDHVAKEMLDNPATPPDVRRDLYREYFPEQVRGTFGRTQSPSTSGTMATAWKAVNAGRTVTGALPRFTSKVAEEVPRRALIRNMIRHSPEFAQAYKAMPRQARSFEAAARKVLAGEGGAAYQRFISRQVNAALGDYLHLSPFERNVVRNTAPFYAWYKAIVTVTGHMAVDTPLRANVLGQIGRIGSDRPSDQDVPSYLKGAIGLGDGANGTKKVLATQGLNPYATLTQLGRGATADLSGLGLNPFLMAPLDTYARSTRNGGQASPGDLALTSAKSLVGNLPLARLAKPPKPSALYPNRGRKSELFGYLGAPVKEYNAAEAARRARQGK